MELSSELFEQIVGSSEDQVAALATENRKRPRFTVGNRAWISPVTAPAGTRTVVTLRDLSVKSVGFSTHHPMALKEIFVLGMTRRAGPPVRLMCQVTRREADLEDASAFVIAGSFIRVFEDGLASAKESSIAKVQSNPKAEPAVVAASGTVAAACGANVAAASGTAVAAAPARVASPPKSASPAPARVSTASATVGAGSSKTTIGGGRNSTVPGEIECYG